ncbi:hypothetical protein N0V93_010289 [Gnomoniopsis smithogilvyi]|uniref:Uncharacterized protein n=1 Tax=Gnomoniopsis smithogilvyi TaxID=1191159 RepID=A0A9W8YIH2_9PEZI|nr:hypothetical protein N0V93_010289 [Gnomoniopsis smithogilvyi]
MLYEIQAFDGDSPEEDSLRMSSLQAALIGDVTPLSRWRRTFKTCSAIWRIPQMKKVIKEQLGVSKE